MPWLLEQWLTRMCLTAGLDVHQQAGHIPATQGHQVKQQRQVSA
jgi:hypothetical protein